MHGFRGVAVLFGVVVALAVTGCGNAVELQGTIGENSSATVTAADGGTVALPSGAAKIVIPAGALSADTEITLNTLDIAGMVDEERLGSYVFDFGPDGTTFARKVEISLKSGGVPDGKEANLAWLDGEKWTKVPGSKLVDGMIVGEIDHFTKFVVYFTDKDVIIETDDDICKDLDFSACGGDPIGTWEIETFCMEPRVDAVDNPWAEQYPACQNGNSTFFVQIEFEGQLDVRADHTATSDFDVSMSVEIVIKDACLEAMSEVYVPAATMCDQIGEGYKQQSADTTVTYASGKCTIFVPQETESGEPQDSTWEVIGNTIYTDGDTEYGEEFCVEGSRLVIKAIDEEDTNDDGVDDTTYEDYMILKRK
ncbi:MAG TPA: hypothetical protein PLY68_02810 [Myxococcota bacterium]|nr:hypothetical protein [Myxococcota bacterium]HQP95109.1 hypothetical protein [Myxococcota bacterium]